MQIDDTRCRRMLQPFGMDRTYHYSRSSIGRGSFDVAQDGMDIIWKKGSLTPKQIEFHFIYGLQLVKDFLPPVQIVDAKREKKNP